MRGLIALSAVAVIFGTLLFGPAKAQDNSGATISALQTKVAEYGDRLDSKSTQIADLKEEVSDLKTQVAELNAQFPTPTPAPAYASGGLGLSRAEWEDEHGSGKEINAPLFSYEDKTFLVMFGENGNILNLSWNLPAPASLEGAQAIARTKLPHDAVLVSTGFDDIGNPRDFYFSESLASRFDPDSPFWGDSGPGSCFVAYYVEADGVTVNSVMVALGNR